MTFETANQQRRRRVWRIPLTGHPENQYITQPLDVNSKILPPGVRFDDKLKSHVVTYGASGNAGPPVLMPHKYELFEKLAYRLGRECRAMLDFSLGPYKPTKNCLEDQLNLIQKVYDAMHKLTDEDRAEIDEDGIAHIPDKKVYNLKNMALNIHKIAPDIAEHLAEDDKIKFPIKNPTQMSEAHAGMILQMQIIEEVSNNWELRFPENEHVWDFADERLQEVSVNVGDRMVKKRPPKRQFFHMQRFPLAYQNPEKQALIITSGPVVQEKPVQTVSTVSQVQQTPAMNSLQPPPKVDRHIRGQQPSFPFGETPYQAAFQSFRIEQDLKDGKSSLPPLCFDKKCII